MAIVDQLGASALPLFGIGKHMTQKGKTLRNGLSSISLLFVVAYFGIFFQMRALEFEIETNQMLSSSLQDRSDSHDEEVWPKPYGWESYSYSLTRRHFACKAYAHDQKKPLPTLRDWQLFQSHYSKIVNDKHIFKDPVPPMMGYTLNGGGPPPYYAGHSADGRGRGLFASRDIKKGELAHDGSYSDVMFPNGMSWRRFIFSLPRNKACDMIDWTWTQKLEEKGRHRIFTAINISILLNSASYKNININPESSTSSKFYATRDIKKDEELLTNYKVYDTVWGEVGLGNIDIVYLSAPLIQEHTSHPGPVWPKPDGWDSFGIKQIEKHFFCKPYARDQVKPFPTVQDWELFQAKYKQYVDNTRSFDDPVPPTMGYTFEGGGPPPYYAKHVTNGKGRGLFASRDIKKGELAHDGTNTNIKFPNAMSWRKFIFSLPRNRACDMIGWTWMQKLEDNGKYEIFSAINISVFLDGGKDKDANVNPTSSTSSKFYATRDIKKGEELLMDYFIYDADWSQVGL